MNSHYYILVLRGEFEEREYLVEASSDTEAVALVRHICKEQEMKVLSAKRSFVSPGRPYLLRTTPRRSWED